MAMLVRILLVVLSAGLGVAVFAPVSWYGLVTVAWVPLLFALRGLKASHAFYLGILHGVFFYGITLSWLVHVFEGSPMVVVPLILILSLFTGFFARGYSVAFDLYREKKWRGLVPAFGACWWLALEFVRCELFTLKFPWMSPGVGLGPMWLSPWLGVYGISLVLILASALVVESGRRRYVGLGVLLVMLFSAWLPAPSAVTGKGIKVMALQSELTDMDHYTVLTEAAKSDVDLIVWPEYGIGMDIRAYPREWSELMGLAERQEAVMVVGTQTMIDDNDWYNTALTFDGQGELGSHYKNHTVHFFSDGTAGTEAKSIPTRLGRIGTPICFDCDYEDTVRRMVADGAELIAVPSMDAEHWSAREHDQHAELFRHRAAENGRWMVVSSTSGLTQIIDPRGQRVKALPLMDDGVLIGEVEALNELTFYTRAGWLFPWVILVVGSVWVMFLFAWRVHLNHKQ